MLDESEGGCGDDVMSVILKPVLFYLDRPDLLLTAAVLSKSMHKNTKSDMLWRLTITEPREKSAMVVLASPDHHNVLNGGTRGPQ